MRPSRRDIRVERRWRGPADLFGVKGRSGRDCHAVQAGRGVNAGGREGLFGWRTALWRPLASYANSWRAARTLEDPSQSPIHDRDATGKVTYVTQQGSGQR